MAKCGYCGNKGMHPFCPKCCRNTRGRLPRLSTEEEANRRFYELKDLREEQNKKDLTKMFEAMQRSRSITTGVPEVDRQLIELFGPVETWHK